MKLDMMVNEMKQSFENHHPALRSADCEPVLHLLSFKQVRHNGYGESAIRVSSVTIQEPWRAPS